jgi:hypothetical protein
MGGPNVGNGTSSGQGPALMITRWWHCQHETSSDRTPLARMLPSVIGWIGSFREPGAVGARFPALRALGRPRPWCAARPLAYSLPVSEVPEAASEAEIEAQFKELGLPLGLIEHLQIAPAPLDLDEESDP